jgi:hypothetical protein
MLDLCMMRRRKAVTTAVFGLGDPNLTPKKNPHTFSYFYLFSHGCTFRYLLIRTYVSLAHRPVRNSSSPFPMSLFLVTNLKIGSTRVILAFTQQKRFGFVVVDSNTS